MRVARQNLGWSTEEFLQSTPRFFEESLNAEIAYKKFLNETNEEDEDADIPHYDYIDDVPAKLRGALYG